MDIEAKSKISGDDDLDALEQDVDLKKQKKSMFLTNFASVQTDVN